MNIPLKDRKIPINDDGDPNFTSLEDALRVFTPDELVELLNRQLRAIQVQRVSARKYAERQRASVKMLNDKLRTMYGITQAKATQVQIESAVRQIVKGER